MAPQDHKKNTLEVYLRQYEQCWEDKRALEAMIWQTPAVFLAIVGVLLAGLISRGFPSVDGSGIARLTTVVTYSLTLFVALAVSSVGTVQLSKHRLWAVVRVDDLRSIEYELSKMADVYKAEFITKNLVQDKNRYPDVKRNWINEQSAYDWLFALSCIVTILLAILLVAFPILACLNCA